jgi:hypothetical protein
MNSKKLHKTEIWAQFVLSQEDCFRIRDFFILEMGIKQRFVVSNMHITVYHARRPMIGLTSSCESIKVILPASETRFMVMAPGGENPREELDPGSRKVGIRVHKQSAALPLILRYRNRLLEYETSEVLGKRSPSTHRRNAFGARYFQPHMTLLRAGSSIDRDLTTVGTLFRKALGNLTFDKFSIDVVNRTAIKENSSVK